jgi:cytochrome c oxidase assembly protein subunit 15
VAFLAPLVVFWLRGSLSPKLRDRLIGVLMLGALQGVVGWWMVRSGLAGRTEVAQERLAIHLLLASLTLSALVWLAVGLKPPRFPLGEREASRGWPLAAVVTSLVLLQIVLGALVAGLRAGYVYDTWPLMDGRLAPAFENLFRLRPWSLNLVENPTMVQFQHRMVGYAVALAASAHLAQMLTLARGKPASRRAFALLGLILVQIGLGVATLLSHVQIAVALAHQAVAMAVLIMAVVQTRRLTLAARD